MLWYHQFCHKQNMLKHLLISVTRNNPPQEDYVLIDELLTTTFKVVERLRPYAIDPVPSSGTVSTTAPSDSVVSVAPYTPATVSQSLPNTQER